MIEIEPDIFDADRETRAYFPQTLARGVGSFRNYLVRDAGRAWVASVGTCEKDWLEGVFDVGLPGLVIVCGDGQPYIVRSTDPSRSQTIPIYPAIGMVNGTAELPAVLYSYTDLAVVRSDGSWWVVKNVSEDGIRDVQIRAESVHLEVWLPERQEWEPRQVSVATGRAP